MLLGGQFPERWQLPSKPSKYDQHVIVNWLEIEVQTVRPINKALLNRLRGWRNREVFYFIRNEWPDWTASAC